MLSEPLWEVVLGGGRGVCVHVCVCGGGGSQREKLFFHVGPRRFYLIVRYHAHKRLEVNSLSVTIAIPIVSSSSSSSERKKKTEKKLPLWTEKPRHK